MNMQQFAQHLNDMLCGQTVTVVSLAGNGRVVSAETEVFENAYENGDQLSFVTRYGVYTGGTDPRVVPGDHLVQVTTDAEWVKSRVLIAPDVSYEDWYGLLEETWR